MLREFFLPQTAGRRCLTRDLVHEREDVRWRKVSPSVRGGSARLISEFNYANEISTTTGA